MRLDYFNSGFDLNYSVETISWTEVEVLIHASMLIRRLDPLRNRGAGNTCIVIDNRQREQKNEELDYSRISLNWFVNNKTHIIATVVAYVFEG